MNREHTWALDFCVPSGWTISFVRPGGDWDREFLPGSEEEAIFKAEGSFYSFEQYVQVFRMFGQQVGKSFEAAAIALREGFDTIVSGVVHVAEILQPVCEQINELNEWELQKHGTYTVKSQKVGIELPVRKSNCGPPVKRFDRRKR